MFGTDIIKEGVKESKFLVPPYHMCVQVSLPADSGPAD